MITFSEEEQEILHQFLEDADTIEKLIGASRPSPSNIRNILVPILRRWLVEGLLFRVQKYLKPEKFVFEIRFDEHTLGLAKKGFLEHWLNFVEFGAISVSPSQWQKKFLGTNGQPIIPQPRPSQIETKKVDVRGFLDQEMLFWDGRIYSRETLLRYHANKLGGVHLDGRRDLDERALDKIRSVFGFEAQLQGGKMLVGKDVAEARKSPSRRGGIYDAIDLVSMQSAQSFVNGVKWARPRVLEMLAPL